MRQLKLIGLACLALFALTAAMASSASALILPEILPLLNEERKFTGENDGTTPILEAKGGNKVECPGGATASGTEEAKKPLGLFHITFKGCKSSGFKCNTIGDEPGIILSLGTWHLVFDQEKPELLTATLFLPEATKFECTGFAKIEVKGSLLCLDLPLLADKKHFLFHCTQTKGVADEKLYLNAGDVVGDNGKVQLLCNKNGLAFEECGEFALGLVLYEKEVTVDA
jgi:hypothetical protein